MSQTDLTIHSKKEQSFEAIKETVNEMVNTIKPTFGPAGNKIIISKLTHFIVCDDGVQGARDYESTDPVKKAIIKLVRETAQKTEMRSGDGTTGAMLVLQAIINEVAKKARFSGRLIEKELLKGLKEAKEILLKSAKQIKTKEDLRKVAMVAFDDEEIAEMIASLYFKLGKSGTITIDKSPSMKTTIEMINGVKLASGYVSPHMINNPQRMEAVIEKPYILITDYRLTNESDLKPIMDKVLESGKRQLVVIAENIEQSALAIMNINLSHIMNPQTRQLGPLEMVGIALPKVEDRDTLLEDLGMLTGARVFSQKKGDKLEDAEIKDLGKCEKFIARREESIFVAPKGNKGDIKIAISQLKSLVKNEPDKEIRDKHIQRLGMFTNTLAVIKVGAPTDNEQKALKYKVEDAVNAVKSAFNSGVVCGGGISLANITTSSSILNEALKYPRRQLLENMDTEEEVLPKGKVKNLVSGQVGNFIEVGLMDSVDVLISGLESAVSIASQLLTVYSIIVESPKEPKIVD